jgi:cyclophilin family peptidyl-prolyl cis-trans isomerase
VLSSSALDALKEFYAERHAHNEELAKLQAKAEALHAAGQLSMDSFTEDWNESQFWVCFCLSAFVACPSLDGKSWAGLGRVGPATMVTGEK